MEQMHGFFRTTLGELFLRRPGSEPKGIKGKLPELCSSGLIPMERLPQVLLRLFGPYTMDICLDLGA